MQTINVSENELITELNEGTVKELFRNLQRYDTYTYLSYRPDSVKINVDIKRFHASKDLDQISFAQVISNMCANKEINLVEGEITGPTFNGRVLKDYFATFEKDIAGTDLQQKAFDDWKNAINELRNTKEDGALYPYTKFSKLYYFNPEEGFSRGIIVSVAFNTILNYPAGRCSIPDFLNLPVGIMKREGTEFNYNIFLDGKNGRTLENVLDVTKGLEQINLNEELQKAKEKKHLYSKWIDFYDTFDVLNRLADYGVNDIYKRVEFKK